MAGKQLGTVSHHIQKYNFSGFGTDFPVNEKQQNCAQDCYEQAPDIKPVDSPKAQQRRDPATDHSAGNSNENGDKEASGIFARMDSLSDCACDEAYDNPC
jgi:hypothetical protein